MEHYPDKPLDAALSVEFLAGLYAQLPILVVRVTQDGILLAANPETERITGYALADLKGKNWWGLMYPGKLFAQIPKFNSPAQAGKFTRDYPLAMRTANGQVRVVAWTRFTRHEAGQIEVVCMGLDITDRLMDAERDAAGVEPVDIDALGECPTMPEESAATVEPLAVSPPVTTKPELWKEAVEQAQGRLALAEDRVAHVLAFLEMSDTESMKLLLRMMRGGSYERLIMPLWGQVQAMYGGLNASLGQWAATESRELGNLVRKGERT